MNTGDNSNPRVNALANSNPNEKFTKISKEVDRLISVMQPSLAQVEVEGTKMPHSGQFGYDNAAYVGSVNTVNHVPRRQPPPTTPITG